MRAQGFPAQMIGNLVSKAKTWNPSREALGQRIRYIDLGSVDNEAKRITGYQEILAEEAPSRARQLVKAGDILVSTVRPNLNGVARVPKDLDGATASTGFCVLRADTRWIVPEYLFHWVKSGHFVSDMEKKATGQSYPAVSDRIIAESGIPLPPLDEQRRIAAILDQADALRRKRREAIDLVSIFPPSLFSKMFSGIKAEDWIRFDDVCELITDGTHYTPTYVESGVTFLSAKNVTTGYINWEEIKRIPETLHIELQRRVSPKLNDVLLAKNGTTGSAALVDRDEKFDIYVSLALLRPSKKILPHFLLAAVQSQSTQRQFKKALKGIGVSNLHLVDIRQAKIPLPSLGDQVEFAKTLAATSVVRQRLQRSHSQTETLFASLQHRAFRGEL